ncbi:MAG: winged helix-turn-helix domain-containing protein, partial [Firmicutes bacterium]|nr:winged helix-turn-helix domain-containing protein [Bacillota bacterium]
MSENKYLIGMEYMDLLQKALVELGGEAPKKTVILKMKELLGDQLKESDRTFEVMAEYARQYLIEGNVMVKEKRGIWTLAKDGEQIEINDELRNKVIEIENTKEKAPRTAKGKRSKSTEDILRWCEPIVNALQTLGGAAKPDEVKKQIIEDVKPDEEYLKQTRGKNQINLFQNEVDFARGYLAQAGIIDKEIRGTWTLTDKAKGLVFDAETIEMI